MTEFTRVTIVGSIKRATIVVPSDESIGALIPRLMTLLDEQVTSVARPLTLLRITGEQLDATLSTAEQSVDDGEILRLLRLDEAPPPPEVSDVTDTVSETLGGRTGLWSTTHRTVIAACAVGAFALATGLESLRVDSLALLPAVVWVAASIAGMVLALAGRLPGARVLLGAALGSTVPVGIWLYELLLVIFIGGSGSTQWMQALVISLSLLLAWVALLLVAGVGRRSRAAALGSGVGVIASLAASLFETGYLTAHLPLVDAEAILASIAVIGVGLIPWYAMSASGLTGLDDQVMNGTLTDRSSVLVTVGDAFRTLSWTTFAVAGILAAALVGLMATTNPWNLWLGIAIALITALRTRAFPLAVQSWALWIAVLIPLIYGLVRRFGDQPVTAASALAVVAIIVAVVATADPARHQRAAIRRFGNVLETIAVISLVPLLLGGFGIYAELLGSFR